MLVVCCWWWCFRVLADVMAIVLLSTCGIIIIRGALVGVGGVVFVAAVTACFSYISFCLCGSCGRRCLAYYTISPAAVIAVITLVVGDIRVTRAFFLSFACGYFRQYINAINGGA